MAVIGRSSAVADLGWTHLSGFAAWFGVEAQVSDALMVHVLTAAGAGV